MLINKAKRAEQNLKNLPFLPLQAEQVEFLFSPLEFKAQIIELIRQAKKRIYVTALYWQKDEAGQEILNEIYRVKQDHPELEKDFFASVRDVIGGRSGSYESTLREAKDTALRCENFSGLASRTTQFTRCRKICY